MPLSEEAFFFTAGGRSNKNIFKKHYVKIPFFSTKSTVEKVTNYADGRRGWRP